MSSGLFCNQPVCVSVFVQKTAFCQRAGGGIESHSVTALVSPKIAFEMATFGHLFSRLTLYHTIPILTTLKNKLLKT